MTVREALRRGAERLAAAGIPDPRREARLLLSHAARLPPAALLRDPERPVDAPGAGDAFDAHIARRAGREPLALILGRQEFWSLSFAVSPATLIPRPDSEAVVEAALAAHPDPAAPLRVLDLGTGTGCLLLAVLHERPAAWGAGVDLSPDAARLAAREAKEAAELEKREQRKAAIAAEKAAKEEARAQAAAEEAAAAEAAAAAKRPPVMPTAAEMKAATRR